jgi:hypothetical protein
VQYNSCSSQTAEDRIDEKQSMPFENAALWMLQEVENNEVLTQQYAVSYICDHFGDSCFYYNNSGNLAISKGVLNAFRKISPQVVWSQHYKGWIKRETSHDPKYRKTPYG